MTRFPWGYGWKLFSALAYGTQTHPSPGKGLCLSLKGIIKLVCGM